MEAEEKFRRASGGVYILDPVRERRKAQKRYDGEEQHKREKKK